MADYKESQVEGKQWTRCKGISIQNGSAPAIPAITFIKELALRVGDKLMTEPAGQVTEPFLREATEHQEANLLETFPRINHQTLEPRGETYTYADLYEILFSAFVYVDEKQGVKDEQPEQEL